MTEVVWTVVVAAGSGRRFGAPKQYAALGDRRMIDIAVTTARSASDGVVVVVPADDVDRERTALDGARCCAGGATRAESVRAGLALVPDEATIVLVHDAARPLASPQLFAAVVDAVRAGAPAVVPAVPVVDTIKVVDDRRRVTATPDRASLVAVQTPQGFRASVLRAAHASGGEGTDDAQLVELAGYEVVVVDGEPANRKVTDPCDLDQARQWLTVS